jgi:hypothetical protein
MTGKPEVIGSRIGTDALAFPRLTNFRVVGKQEVIVRCLKREAAIFRTSETLLLAGSWFASFG